MRLRLTAVADAGGWTDVSTLMRCYRHSDKALLLALMENRRARHDLGQGPRLGAA